MSMTGCAGIQTPLGTHSFDSAEPAPKETPTPKKAPEKEKSFEESSGMSPTVAVLLGIGAATMLMSVGAMNYDDGNSGEEFAVITGVSGLLIWSVAGIVWVIEE